MSPEVSAPCPHCRAENLSHRRNCWRCKRTLPTSFALDALTYSARMRHFANLPGTRPTQEDIDEALSLAVIIEEAELTSDPFPQGDNVSSRRLLWFLRRSTRHA
jgi:hypothetical protein